MRPAAPATILMGMTPSSRPLRVLVVGGGFAAAEALLALRAFAGDLVSLTLLSPDRRLVFRPAATAASFLEGPVQSYDLAALAEDVGASLRDDVLESVAPAAKQVRTAKNAHLEYDALLLAIGARARKALPGALTFRDHRDACRVGAVIDELRAGELKRLVLAAPPGVTWTLPLYELALYAAAEIEEHRLTARVSLVSPEREPLQVFGRTASEAVAGQLAEHDVRFMGSALSHSVDRRQLRLADAETVRAERVIALPLLTGRRLSGLPSHDFSGFVQTDDRGRVEGLDAVWAAGDMTTCPIKQGGLAAQQAEVAAADIAELAGAPPRAPRPIVLRAKLLGGGRPLYLRTELDAAGRAVASSSFAYDEPPWWPDTKVFGRHVTPWMAAQGLQDAFART